LFRAIGHLKANPGVSRAEFSEAIRRVEYGKPTDPAEPGEAVALVVKVFLMLDCSEPYRSSNRLEDGIFRIHWQEKEPFSKYIQHLFPIHRRPSLGDGDGELLSVDLRSEIRATKLKKHLGIRIQATHNIQNHLRYHKRENTLEIFHHTAFLKEQLRLTRDSERCEDAATAIKL